LAELYGLSLKEILESCCENGVSFFKSGELVIHFNRWPVSASKNKVQSSIEGDGLSQDASGVTNDKLDELLMEDPAAYEDALVRAKTE